MTEMHRVPDEAVKCFCDALFRRRVNQKRCEQPAEFVSSRAVDRPIVPQSLAAGENFLEDEIDGASVFRQRTGQRRRGGALQFPKIFRGQIKTVRMIDPQTSDRARLYQLEQ